MGRQIIKQPNGRFCVFSSIVDNVIWYDMEQKDIVEYMVKEFEEDKTIEVKGIIDQLNIDEKPYLIFTKSYDEMISTIKDVHGKKEAEKVDHIIKK